MESKNACCYGLATLAVLMLLPLPLLAEEAKILPDIAINIGGSQMASDGQISASLKIIFLLTALSFAPAMMVTMTCFTRIAVVLGMVRTSLGVQSMPPNTVITGLALFLTFAIMNPIFMRMYDEGVKPFMDGQMEQSQALEKTFAPLKEFLIRHSREKDIQLFLDITRSETPKDISEVSMAVAVPSFGYGGVVGLNLSKYDHFTAGGNFVATKVNALCGCRWLALGD